MFTTAEVFMKVALFIIKKYSPNAEMWNIENGSLL